MQTKLLKASSILGVILLAACSNNSQEGYVKHQTSYSVEENKMLRANRYLNKKDMLVVEGYIERHGLKMNLSDFGFYYRCVEKGGSKEVKSGSVVLYSYKVQLIDGTPLDSSGVELAQLVIDKSDGIAGLHEGLKYFHEGDSAQFIFTPHSAYGLVGDGEKIPSRATLVYDVRIKSVQ
jgi:FKBP-type peptidyl-prolyl cis-trans isomerase